jgi:hypothetical protein
MTKLELDTIGILKEHGIMVLAVISRRVEHNSGVGHQDLVPRVHHTSVPHRESDMIQSGPVPIEPERGALRRARVEIEIARIRAKRKMFIGSLVPPALKKTE